MNRLEELRKANPEIKIYDVKDARFERYGRYIPYEGSELGRLILENTEMPKEGSKYFAALSEADESFAATEFRNKLCGELDEQIGVCLGHSNRLNALEWHTCSEFNLGVTDLVLLLAKREDLAEGKYLDSKDVEAFYLGQGEMIEVYSDTLHFCPCEVSSEGFICMVGLERGTNLPLTGQKDGLIWAKNKWLIAHEENTSLVERGGFPGIKGENITLRAID